MAPLNTPLPHPRAFYQPDDINFISATQVDDCVTNCVDQQDSNDLLPSHPLPPFFLIGEPRAKKGVLRCLPVASAC